VKGADNVDDDTGDL